MKAIFTLAISMTLTLNSLAQGIKLEPFSSGFKKPVDISATGISNDKRLFIVEQDGIIKIIDENKAAGNTSVFKFVGINSAKLNSVEIEKQDLIMGVKFESQIISATLNANKEIVSGDEKTVSTLKEVWTFERDLYSKDPNWTLVATQDPNADQT